jgi:hypothetical protein
MICEKCGNFMKSITASSTKIGSVVIFTDDENEVFLYSCANKDCSAYKTVKYDLGNVVQKES